MAGHGTTYLERIQFEDGSSQGRAHELLARPRNLSQYGFVDIGKPDTEREIHVVPVEEPLPRTAPAEEPVPVEQPVPA
jgi:hypothetical protein